MKHILTLIIRHAINPRGKKGKTMKRIVLALMMILSASLLAAQTGDRWIHFFTATADGGTAYYDNQTVVYRAGDNQYATAWVKVAEPSGEFGMLHLEMHATSRHMRSLSYARYDASGKQVTSSFEPTTWDDIIPESLADCLLHRLYRIGTPAPPSVRY
jgi:hypothetical protein